MASPVEEIVMTPSKKGRATHIKIERVRKLNFDDSEDVALKAGGQHKGLVIKKETGDEVDLGKPKLTLGFTCFLVDSKTGRHVVENRKLKFWFIEGSDYLDQVTTAYEFFKELVKPESFPRDYVGFIKKCMKQMQDPRYVQAKKVDLEMQQLTDEEAPLSPGLTSEGLKREDTRPESVICREKLLYILESAYPNVLAVEDLVRITAHDDAIVTAQLQELHHKQLVQEMPNGGFMRQVLDTQTEVQMVKQMPTIDMSQQPSIAIITAAYYEKLAVDAMMANKMTYMKYKTEGEANVYTIGYIGSHKCVSTKLPAIGHARAAQISSGNTTTRLLGSFQNIDHVFVVGCAGGVPHYTNYYKHVRLGDIVVSHSHNNSPIYYYCDKIFQEKDGPGLKYQTKTWTPTDLKLQRITGYFAEQRRKNQDFAPWEKYIPDGQEILRGQEVNFLRPEANTDRLYMDIGDNNVIEVDHPVAPDDAEVVSRAGVSNLHLGILASGRPVIRSDTTRLDFANRYNITAFDTPFDQVLDSIVGNVKDSFMFIRGISDYADGTKHKSWQPYAALSAAAFMKSVIVSLPV